MADYYVYSGAAGAGTGADWANAFTTIATAISGKGAGDRFFVADDHSESTAAAVSWAFGGTEASPQQVLCVRRSGGSVPPVAADLRTTAVAVTTGNNSLSISGNAYIYGMLLTGANGTGTAGGLRIGSGAGSYIYFKSCTLKRGNTGGTNPPIFGSSTAPGASVVLDDCKLELANTGIRFAVGAVNAQVCRLIIKNCPNLVQGSIPTSFLDVGAGTVLVVNCDISPVTGALVSSASNLSALFVNCKLGSGVTPVSGATSHAGTIVSIVNCDSADTNYRNERHSPEGAETTETVVVKTGGSSDGTTAYSYKMASTSLSSLIAPMVGTNMLIYNATSGSSKTVSVSVLTDNVTLTDAEAWLEVDYVGDANFPLGSMATDAVATILTTPANQATDTATWTTTGIGTPVKQLLSVSFTPQQPGYFYVRVMLAKPSTTVYVDRLPVVT